MVSAGVLEEINTLQESEQAIVLGFVKSFVRRNNYKTEAQNRFEEMRKKYG